MKKVWMILTVIMMLIGYTHNGYAYQDVEKDNIEEVNICYITRDIDEQDLYKYTTRNKNEIKMIAHFIEALKKTEGGGVPTDSQYISVHLDYGSGSVKCCDIYPTVLYTFDSQSINTQGQIYKFPITEYYRMCDFINSLILNEFDKDTVISTEPSEWSELYIDKAITNGIIPEWNQIGYKNYISRVEVCQLIDSFFTAKGIDKGVSSDYTYLKEYPFDDTRDISVKELYMHSIIKGKSETEFCPYDCITREEYAVILSNTYKTIYANALPNILLQYKDKERISDWAIDGVKMVTFLGLMQGDEGENFSPKYNITKEEVITTLLRLYQL